MKILFGILLVALVGAQNVKAVKALSSFATANHHKSLINYLMLPSGFNVEAANDPQLTTQCFSKYVPLLTEIADTYSTQYQACITIASQQLTNLTTAASKNQAEFINSTTSICNAYQTCANETDVLDFFDCYATESAQDVSVVYSISTNASNAATTLSRGIQTVQQSQDECTNTTQQTYITDTATTYEQLDKCLQTGIPSSTTAAPTGSTDSTTGGSTDSTTGGSTDSTTGGSTDTTNAEDTTTVATTGASTETTTKADLTTGVTTAKSFIRVQSPGTFPCSGPNCAAPK